MTVSVGLLGSLPPDTLLFIADDVVVDVAKILVHVVMDFCGSIGSIWKEINQINKLAKV
jgi:hypothetical protein